LHENWIPCFRPRTPGAAVFLFPQTPGGGRPSALASPHKRRRAVALAALRAGGAPIHCLDLAL